jgi:hypothetical protein
LLGGYAGLKLHSSKQALDDARASGVEAGTLEAFEQLDELLVAVGGESGTVVTTAV